MSRVRGRPRPSVSVVVPVRDEADSIGPLVAELGRALDGWLDYELIVVDDGSRDATWQRLDALRRTTPRLRAIRHRAGYGQSAALWTGVRGSRGRWIVTLDGDGQNDPADIPRLLPILQAGGQGTRLVLGHRARRRASLVRRLSSRVANGVRGRLLGDHAPDSGCGLKAFERRAFLALPYFDHMHRFLPALFLRAGGNVVSVPVNDRPRVRGVSKYGLHDRLWVGLVDLLGVMWLQARGRMPVIDGAAGGARVAPAPHVAGDARGWIAAWLLVVAATLLFRPLFPVDETRYAAVAWEMWVRGDFLVPHLNGEPYSHKPPLLFWAIHLGWWLFGVTDWWARLVSPLFGLGALALTAALGRQLWPDRPGIARFAPWLVLGTVAWAVATTLTMFDTALTFCALLGLLGLARASRADGRRGWPMLALATGLGLLAKGPVVLLFIVPVAVAAPWWGRPPRSWRRWYAAVVGALGAGASVALAWAVPAAQRGGAAYGAALLWTQTVDRLAASFAHHRPVWWYVAVLPVLLLPWSAWPALWRAAAAQVGRCAEPGLRFVVVWFAAAFAGLSLVSGKQVHYLLPALPAVGLLAARTVLGRPGADPVRRLRALALASVTLVAVANVIAQPVTGDAWDVTSLAARIHTWQEEGRPVAHVGKYHGQFHFPGRLTRPLQVIDEGTEQQWLRRHPGGRIVVYQPRGVPLPSGAQFVHPYRVKTAVVLGNAERRGGARQPRPDDSDS